MRYKVVILLFLTLLLSSCGDADKEATLEGESVVVAVVNGAEISQFDLDLAIRKLVGAEAATMMDEAATKKVLESMVMSRAISQLREKEMNALEKAEIAKEVAVFREQLLVRRYLAKHSPPQPVTMEMVQDYYDGHPELFGAKKIRMYEMITTKRALNANERDELLGKLQDPGKHGKWQDWAKELAAFGYPVTYRQGRDGGEVLHPKLNQVMGSLAPGQSSPLIFVKETPYLIRITSEENIPAQPLAEVTGAIKKALGPKQLKQAVEQVGKEALANAKVEYK
ncbi:MAG: peptidyl-prolyl cis-trans isomerase [Proteobacteria bacterium]|nr:peptidyl-prolyl cis-trans isomerase [Pseudomonadota bacterium]MBU1638859.1 peptidyl-prolyl cis-trans isomerase [Pseudomonadota bacterium]